MSSDLCCFGSFILNAKKRDLKIVIGSIFVFSVVIVAVMLLLLFNKEEKADDELIFVHTLCRHGDRNIYESFPTDPWGSEEYWPKGFAALTKVGEKAHFELGQYLRKRYESLIGNSENPSETVYVHSTESDRVLLSAQRTIAGLFSDETLQNGTENFDFQVPIHFIPREEDFLLYTEKECDRFDYEMIKYINSSEYQSTLDEKKALIDYLEQKSGEVLDTLTKINHFYDKLFIEELKGFRLPLWAQEVMGPNGDLEYLATALICLSTRTTEMKKIKSGFLLKEILDRSKNKTHSILIPPDRKLWMYFAHDFTVANMLSSLNIFQPHIPPYSSCIFFELYKSYTGDYMKVYYRNSTETNISPEYIPECGINCPLDRWYELYEHILPSETVEIECALRDGEIMPPGGNPETIT